MMGRVHYAVRYRLDHKDRYLIWHTVGDAAGDEADGVVIDESGLIPVFRTSQSLIAYLRAEALTLANGSSPAFYNLDVISRWLTRKRPGKLDCVAFLDVWNLLADLSASVGGDFDRDKDKTRQIYSKLFWGSHIPAVTHPGRQYEPMWSGKESRIIREVLRDGLALLRSHTAQTQPKSFRSTTSVLPIERGRSDVRL